MKDKLIVLLDADDTILDFKQCEHNAAIQVAKHIKVDDVEGFAKNYNRINQGVWKEFEEGKLTVDEINYTRFDRIFDLYNITGFDSLETGNYYKDRLAEQAILFDGAREFLDKAQKEFRLQMVTNGIEYTQSRRFKKADLNKYFENIFVSETIGVRKPQKEFFDYVESHIDNYNIENAILVGDSLSSDIAGGVNSGLKTIWFNIRHNENKTAIKPTWEFDTFDDVLKKLRELAK